jgi:hypothetical protein
LIDNTEEMELPGPDHSELDWGANHVDRVERPTELDAHQRDCLVSLVHSDPPPGWTKWTLSRLAEELIASGIVATISPEEVRRALLADADASVESKSSGRSRDAGLGTQIE